MKAATNQQRGTDSMTAPWANVRVADHSFGIFDRGEVPIDTADWSNGLIAVMSVGALVCTGIHTGYVRAQVVITPGPPENLDASGWDEIIETTLYAPYGQLRVDSLDHGPVQALPLLSAAGAGWYRTRIHARGRDLAYDAVRDQPVEDYLLVTWPHPVPTTIIRATERTQRPLHPSAPTSPPPAAGSPEQAAEFQRRQQLHHNLLRAARKPPPI